MAVGAEDRAVPERTAVAASAVSVETPAPRATRSSSASISSAVWNRSSGLFASARSTIMSRSGGMSGRSTDGGRGASERCFMAISTGVSPLNGVVPVSIS